MLENHDREAEQFYTKVWTIKQPKNNKPEGSEDDMTRVTYSIGKDAELLVRARCSQRGKNAVARYEGGLYFVYAWRATGSMALRSEVLTGQTVLAMRALV